MKMFIQIFSLFFALAALADERLPEPTFVKFEGSPEGYVARGEKKTFRSHEAEITADTYGHEGITISVRTAEMKNVWTLIIEAPRGASLQAKAYSDALRAGNDGTKPVLDFFGNGCGYNSAAGEFQILELQYGANGKPKSLAVDFHIKEGEGQKKNWVKGLVRFHSAIPETEIRPAGKK